jgi:hypothetical protein
MNITNPFLALGGVAALGVGGLFLYREQLQNVVVLERITAVEARLAANNRQGAQAMASTVSGISVAISKNQNMARDVAVLQQSRQIVSRAKSLVDTLHRYQRALRAVAREAPAGALHRPAAASQPGHIWPRQLARHLNRYTAFIRAYVPEVPALTQTGPEETPWLYAEHSPVAAALASLTRLEAQVRRQATQALDQQAQKVGSGCCMCFDKIGAMAVAASNTVAPGATYEAQLFLTQAASGYQPGMRAEGKALVVQPNGRAPVEIRVPPLQPNQPDTVRAQWQGTIRLRKGLTDTSFRLSVPYLIVKPAAR